MGRLSAHSIRLREVLGYGLQWLLLLEFMLAGRRLCLVAAKIAEAAWSIWFARRTDRVLCFNPGIACARNCGGYFVGGAMTSFSVD